MEFGRGGLGRGENRVVSQELLSTVSSTGCWGCLDGLGEAVCVSRCCERGGLDAVVAVKDSVEERVGLFALR